MNSPTKIPPKIAVMVLPEIVLFPGALLPLHIFEPRYRTMLTEALESHRMFAIGLSRLREEEVFPVGCVGLVRACVANPDGTSHLMLQGIERVRFKETLPGKPYPLAKVEVLRSESPPSDMTEILRGEIKNLCGEMKGELAEMRGQIETLLDKNPDLAAFSDLAGFSIVTDIAVRQQMLTELNVTNRLAIMAAYLVRLICPD